MGYVYRITNKINGKAYIGQTTETIGKRWKRHCKPTSHCRVLSLAIKKYGQENFTIEELLKSDSLSELNSQESYFIEKFRTLSPNGYNLTTGGENPAATQEVKEKLSKAHSGKNHHMFGKHHSTETKLKMSLARIGLPSWNLGRKYKKTVPMSEAQKKILSEKHKVSIQCVETGKIFSSISDASRFLNVSISAVSNVLRAKSKSCKGLTFKYCEER